MRVDRGYEEDCDIDPKVAAHLHISEAFEQNFREAHKRAGV